MIRKQGWEYWGVIRIGGGSDGEGVMWDGGEGEGVM